MKRVLLVVNPYSSQVTGGRITEVESALRERVTVQTEFTRRPGHATEIVARAVGDVDAIVVFAGDGTYNEALNGADRTTPFGFLPGGGTSVLPRALGLPREAAAAARVVAAALDEGRARRISVGAVNGRRFCFSAGIGFDAEAVRRLDALGRSPGGARPGDLVFARVIASMVLERQGRWEPQVEIEGAGRAAFALVANCDPYSYAGPLPLHVSPAATFEGGLDFAAPVRVGPLDVPRLALELLRGTGSTAGILRGHDLDRIVARCGRPLPLQADGEDLGDVVEAVFEADRDAVAVLS